MAADAEVVDKPAAAGAVGGTDKGTVTPDAGAGAAADAAGKTSATDAGADKGSVAKAPAAGDAKGAAKPDAGKAADPARGFLDDDGDDPDVEEQPAAAAKSTDKPTDDKTALPDNWRDVMSGGDEKALSRLKRYASPQNVVKALLAAEQKIRSGEYKKALGEDATDEEKAQWRKDNGIPEKPEDYKVADVEGRKWDEADKPVINTFLKQLHGANASQAVIDKMLATYAQVTTAQKEAAAEKDRADDLAIRDHLRDTLGNDFTPTRKLMARALGDPELMPSGLGAMLKDARTADGTRLVNTTAFADWLANFAVDNYGAGSMITGEGDATLNSREEELVKMMRSNIDEYQNGRNAKGQTFATELYEIRQKKAASAGRMRRA